MSRQINWTRKTRQLAISTVAGSMLLATLASAQPHRGGMGEHRERMNRGHERLVELLDLTESQQAAWEQARQAQREDARAVMDQLRANRLDLEQAIEAEDALRVGELTLEGRNLRAQAKAGAEAHQEDLGAILDDAQRERWEGFRAAARERGPRHHGRGGPRGPRGDAGPGV